MCRSSGALIFLFYLSATDVSPLCGSWTIRMPVNMFPLYDHMNLIIEISIFIKKAPAGRHISRKIHTQRNQEPQSGDTFKDNIVFKIIFIYAKQFISLQKR